VKSKLSVTVEDDALAMLKEASNQEGISVSAMTEKAIRYVCADYAPHRVEVDWLENGRTSVKLERNGRPFYYRRGVRRHLVSSIQGSVIIDTPGPIDTTLIPKILREHKFDDGLPVTSGRPIVFEKEGCKVEVTNFPIRAESDLNFLKDLIHACATSIEELEITSFREIAKRRCPTCNVPFIGLSIWMPEGEKEEVEWVCGIGHRTSSNDER